MKKKRVVAVLVLLVVVAGGIFFFTSSGKSENQQWLTLPVTQGNLDVVVTATGTLAADTTVQVGTQVSGTIAKLYADWNTHVRRGQVLAQLDTTFLWASVEQAEANLKKAQVASDQAQRTFNRVKQLFQRNLDSQSDYDTALSDFQTAQANVLQAQTALDQSKINLSYATIKSPISGVVISRNVDIGQTVASSFNTPTLFTVANSLADMQIQASVDEGDIGSVKVGQPVTFTVDAFSNDTFKGRVTQIRLQPTVVQNVVEYTVIIDVPNPDLKLMPGMTANLTIQIAEAKDVLKVPTTALRFVPPKEYSEAMMKSLPDSVKKKIEERRKKMGENPGFKQGGPSQSFGQGGGQSFQNRELTPGSYFRVWVLNGKDIKPIRVMVGLSDGTNTQVTGELSAGEQVVIGSLTQTGGGQNNPFMQRRRF